MQIPSSLLSIKETKQTIFDLALEDEDLARIEPVIAHLAIIEKRGSLITETTKTAINSNNRLKNILTNKPSEKIF